MQNLNKQILVQYYCMSSLVWYRICLTQPAFCISH